MRQRVRGRLDGWRVRWLRFSLRERTLMASAALLIATALLWQVAIAPAWITLRQLPAEQRQTDLALARMQQQATLAATLREQPGADSHVDPLAELQRLTYASLGTGAGISEEANEVKVTVERVSATQLGSWLRRLQPVAHARPLHIALQRTDAGSDSVWSGVVTLQLPVANP